MTTSANALNEFLDNKFEGAPDEGAAPPVEPAPVVDTPAVDVDSEPDKDMYPLDYVKKLRQEAAGYRTKARSYEEAFEGHSDDSREALLWLAKTLRSDPTAAAKEMQAAAKTLLGGDATPAEEAEAKEVLGDYMTEARYLELREQEAVQQELKNIQFEAKELGYTVGSVDYRLLLQIAQESESGDLKEAHAKIQARDQAAIDRYIASKAEDAENSGKVFGGTAAVPGSSEPIRTFKDARAAMDAFIQQQRAGN